MGRLSAYLAVLFVLFACKINAGELTEWERASIREQYQEALLNRPATTRNASSDRAAFAIHRNDSSEIDEMRYAPLPTMPSVRVFTNNGMTVEKYLKGITKSAGFSEPVYMDVSPSLRTQTVKPQRQHKSMVESVSWLEDVTGARILLYPDERTLQVIER